MKSHNPFPQHIPARFLLLALALFLAPFLPAQSEPDNAIEADSKIEAVTVFLRSAQVTRTADIALQKGRNEVLFRGLAEGIDPRSIQVSAPPEVLINTVVLESNFLDPNQEKPRIKVLTDSLKILGELGQDLVNQRSVLDAERRLLEANRSLASEKTGLDVEELKVAAAFFRRRMTDIIDQLRAVERQEKAYEKRKSAINKQLAALNYQKTRRSQDIRVVFSVFSSRKTPVQLKYVVSQAGWAPRYDLRVQNTSSPVQIDYRADVYQQTGVDWSQVDLTLSTGNPNLGGQQPELSTWNLYVYVPPPPAPQAASDRKKMGSREKSMEASEDDGDYMSDAEESTLAAVEITSRDWAETATLADYTEVREGATTASFEIGVKQDIPSSGKPQQVSIQSSEVPADYRHFAVPKLSSDSYLLAEVTGWEKLNLLAGPVQIFFEGTYVTESNIDPSVTQDTLRFSLGRDPRLIVQRELLKDFSETKTLGANREKTFAWKTTIRNSKSEAVTLRLEDQVPISQDKNIVVKVEEISGGSLNPDTGLLEWDIELPPSGVKEIMLVYSVRYPKDKVIPGI